MLSPLPIDAVLPELADALRQHPSAVLRAPTGSGKTTRVPGGLLDANVAAGQVVMLEPRRVAARAAARRIAFERGGNVGDEVGYQVRFEQKVSKNTRIRIVTDGILLRWLQDDPFLENVGVVVFDEFHERSVNVDLGLAMVRRIQESVRPDLKIVVMSATLDLRSDPAEAGLQDLPAFLGGAPVAAAEGRLHPVTIHYRPAVGREPLPQLAASGVLEILDQTPGDVLVFLPGVGEIRRTQDELSDVARSRNLAVLPLYGDLPPEQQDAVLLPGDRRKVVLATNVAETSLTIEGVTGVVDTGYARILEFDATLGLDRLELQRISKASADQRAGRAGRTAPGVCLRLWSERDHRALPEFTVPEIRRVDLAGPALQLRCWGEDPARFPWYEAPPALALERADGVLKSLHAIEASGVTGTGRDMARLPVHPRIARLLLEGRSRGILRRAALAGALLSERDPFERDFSRRRSAQHASESDVVDRVIALEDFERLVVRGSPDPAPDRDRRSPERSGDLRSGGGAGSGDPRTTGRLIPAAARAVLRVRDQLLQILSERSERSGGSSELALRRALFTAFADRLARRREPGSRKALMVGGRGVRLDEQSAVLEAELFVCVDVDAGGQESLVRQASAVERDWLSESDLTVKETFGFDAQHERVTAIRTTLYLDLPIAEASMPIPDDDRTARVLAEAAGPHWERVLPKDDDEIRNFIARVRCLREWCPQLELPPFADAHLRRELPALCRGCRSFADLRRAPWLAFVKGLLTWPQLQAVEREAPERLAVPSGKRIAVKYEEGKPPVLAVRIQDLFGLAETPRIAGGRVPVLLHLLAPNMRPQQVTTDLKSFWINTYPQVRKDLRRRYPKHAWPENPWEFCREENAS